VSRSLAEAEYRAMATITSDLIWIKSILASMRVFLTQPMQLYCDNLAALHISKNPVFHKQTKHIEMDCHFVRERLLSGEMVNQVADIFTKALGKQSFIYLQSKLGMVNLHAPT